MNGTSSLKHVVIGTSGHIDHGKSTLVQALTGTDPDRLQEEKARGITIDLGFAHTVERDVVLSFVDVPGHERFIRNMLAGAGGIDLVLLHVAADESVMPQTREHFDICCLLHVRAGLVVITKADLVDADTIDVVRLEVQEMVAGSFLERAPVLAVSARTGAGMPELRQTLARLATETTVRPSDGPPRLPIDRVFSMRGFGTIVTGTLTAGRIAVDDELVLLPGGRRVRARGVQVHGTPCRAVAAGGRAAVNLTGVEVSDLARGETLTTAAGALVTRRVDVQIELLPSAKPLRHGARLRFHQGTLEVLGRVALVEPDGVAPGAQGFARLHLEGPAALRRDDRFILRAYSPLRTIGGGRVLDPLPPRRGVRSSGAADRFARLGGTGAGATAALELMIEDARLAGFPVAHLGPRAGVPWDRHQALVAELEDRRRLSRVESVLVAASHLSAAQAQALEVVARYHDTHPLEDGVPREELRARVCGAAPVAVFEHVLSALMAAGRVTARDRVALAGRHMALTAEEIRVRDAMVRALDDAGLTPPDEARLIAGLGGTPEMIRAMATLLVRQKVLVRTGDLLFHEAPLRRLKDEIRRLKQDEGLDRLEVAVFKARYQVTRRHAIPLLEFLDRERVTRRVGETRMIL